ncbi:hypothetical protein F511_20049 [Dorcoceras hygrometricum]|uniref:Uncharacterized protein n=1 Tax=Dorcoceras hygrometricum TaxID=472368 RepID=A0A2Z7DC76_9LAMI|nr:hypothetical protein F511_20049 [Dorcoceras hygrometricum]
MFTVPVQARRRKTLVYVVSHTAAAVVHLWSLGVLTAAGCGIGSVHAVVRSNLLVEPSEVEEGEMPDLFLCRTGFSIDELSGCASLGQMPSFYFRCACGIGVATNSNDVAPLTSSNLIAALANYQQQATGTKITRSWTPSRNNETTTFPLQAKGMLTRVDICFC